MIEILQLSLIAFTFTALGRPRMIFEPYQRMIKKLPIWLSYPLGECHICFVGQVMLWVFIFTHPFNFFELCFFISAGIMCSCVYNKLYNFLNDN